MISPIKKVTPFGGTSFMHKSEPGRHMPPRENISNYLYLRFLAASDFFFLFTLGFS